MLQLHRDVLHSLAEQRLWHDTRKVTAFDGESLDDEVAHMHFEAAHRMHTIAHLASQSGEHDAAIALLQSMQVRQWSSTS